ncbi:MAG: AAA family ATPase, partial [Solirubrobacteraceae bacterium]|nr:AAA family ATPase [Solirubrobacteraceae bacterium]
MIAGYVSTLMSTSPPPISVAEAMARSGFYPGHPPVTVRETHTAWVFLAGEHAYKVKKPVRMAFLDFSTLERRRRVCEDELRVNRELAPQLDMRLRAIVLRADSYVLADPDAEHAVEYALQMRRFDEQRTMAALVERDELGDEQIRAVARRLAAFHEQARPAGPRDPVGDVKRTWDHNMCELLALADDETARRALAADRFAGTFVLARRGTLRDRAQAGRIRDGHGDLRAEHVVLEESLMIVDRLEFNAALREIDVADDLAFLAMDLERLGAGSAARLLVAAYRDAGGDPGDDALLAYYGAYRALVRAKVDLLRAAQLAGVGNDADADAARAARTDADALLDLAERLAWRARGPLVLAIGGPPASGKSTLAAELARRSGVPVLSSDVLRKQHRGLELRARAPDADYTPSARAAVYRELGECARASCADGESAIVDATFGDRRLRAAFLAGL